MTYTLGSLFDGSGGFPLAGSLCGIEPKWAAEVEPYPIAVTRSRFPNMKHFGDVSKINGAEIEPVDVITFGSPCQDLSVAGKRAGLKHEANGDEETTRSGLFMEAVRIIKEMRRATDGKYPSFALWENVPGAFSSNGGEDFRTVCEELIKIVEPDAVMPEVPANGWAYADCYVGDGWSLSYRVFDAQYWGVPQRRRRIHLVLDLRGERAREVLFEREGVRGYFETGRTPWQGTAADAEGGAGADDRERKCVVFAQNQREEVRDLNGVAVALNAQPGTHQQTFIAIADALPFDTTQVTSPHQNGNNPKWGDPCHPLAAQGHPPTVICKTYDARGNGDGETVNTLTGDHSNRITDYTSVIVENAPIYCLDGDKLGKAERAGGSGLGIRPGDTMYTLTAKDCHSVVYACSSKQQSLVTSEGQANTLGANDYKEPQVIAYAMQAFGLYKESEVSSALKQRDYKDATDLVCGVDCRNLTEHPELYPTLQAKPNGGQSLNYSGALRVQYIVRRLTPTECARLQGFADCWGEIDQKDDFTDEELQFWLDVRNTHAAINGREAKEYTKTQMLSWYNKLHTDSAEYKMWGNGIALPPAMYCMQGITYALEGVSDEWML